MSTVINGPSIVCSACGVVTNSLNPLCPACEQSLAAFQFAPPNATTPGDPYSEQGVHAWWLDDYSMYAGRDLESAKAAALEDWGGASMDYWDDFEPDMVNLDQETMIDGEPGDEDAKRLTVRKAIRRVLADPTAKLGWLCGIDA